MIDKKMKRCSGCKKMKSLTDFYRNKGRPDGRGCYCKKCAREYGKNDRKKKPEKYRLSDRRKNEKRPHYRWAQQTIIRHRSKGYDIEITFKELEKIALKADECILCGRKLNWVYGSKGGRLNNYSPTLDRMNNEKIINKDNIQILCFPCNTSKRDRTMKEFILYCRNVIERYEKRGDVNGDFNKNNKG